MPATIRNSSVLLTLLSLAACGPPGPSADERFPPPMDQAPASAGPPAERSVEEPAPAPQAPTAATEPQGSALRYESCRDIGVLVPVDRATLEREVPEGYTLAGSGPRATLVLWTGACDRLELDGRPAGAFTYSFVAVSIASPDGSPGDHFYFLQGFTDSAHFHGALRRAGLSVELLPSIDLSVTATLGEHRGEVHVAGMRAGYDIDSRYTAAFMPEHHDSLHWWRAKARGRAHVNLRFTSTDWFGMATVRASEGSVLAEWLGGTEVQALSATGVNAGEGSITLP